MHASSLSHSNQFICKPLYPADPLGLPLMNLLNNILYGSINVYIIIFTWLDITFIFAKYER